MSGAAKESESFIVAAAAIQITIWFHSAEQPILGVARPHRQDMLSKGRIVASD